MSVLQPKIADGTIKIGSGETEFNTVATLRWDAAVAKKRMENILTKSYGTSDVHGVLAPYDGLSRGIIAALKGAGYGTGGKKLPVVTGQDAELESVKMILSGEQYSTVFKAVSYTHLDVYKRQGRLHPRSRQRRALRGAVRRLPDPA